MPRYRTARAPRSRRSECDLRFGIALPCASSLDWTSAPEAKEAILEGLRTAVPLEDAGEVVLLLDENGVITRASGNVEKLLGYAPPELIGRHAALIRQNGDDTVMRRKDGTTPFPDISLAPVTNGDAKVFSVTLRDLRAHEREKERQRIYESLLEAAPDAIVVVDDNGLVRLANRQVELLFGYAPGELLGVSVDILVPARPR